jgi:phage terminase large subunit-like protein
MAKRPAPYEFPRSALADPVEFAHTFLIDRNGNPLRLHDGQIELLHGIQRYTVIAAGRQWGKSTSMGVEATWFGATHANRQIWIIAPSLEQSRIIFDEIVYHFSHPPLSYLVKGKIKEYPFPQITLVNGTQFHARGANSPQYIRGNRSHLTIIDEAAHMKDKVITDAIEPMMTVTGQEPGSAQIMISTPFGRGAFYDAYMAAKVRGDGAYFHYTSLDNPYADQENLERIKQRYGESSFLWQTEYMAEFLDDDMSVFPWKDVQWAYENYPYVTPKTGRIQFPYQPLSGHRYLQGTDLANQRDFFVSAILDGTDAEAGILVRYDRWQRRGYSAAKRNIRDNYARYNHARTLIDATTLAESVVEDLHDIRAEGYKFTGSTAKYEIVQELARSFSEHKLRIPQDQTLLDELRYFAYSITPSKNLKIEASQGHDDTVMALALANHLFIERRGRILVAGVGSPNQYRRPPAPKPNHRPKPGEWVDPFAEAFKMD